MGDQMEKPELYHPDILALAQNPPRWRKEHVAQYCIKAYNAVCGDKFEIRLDIDEVITDASFFGYGCVVSKASTALLVDLLVGLNADDAGRMIRTYLDQIHNGKTKVNSDSRFVPFMIARKYPGRVQCAVLAWETLLQSGLDPGST